LLNRSKVPRQGLQATFHMWRAELPVEYQRFDPNRDLATFRISLAGLGVPASQVAKTLPFDILGSADELNRGDGLYTVGHASGGRWVVPNQPVPFAGFTSSTTAGERDAIKIEHTCLGGHSGGAVYDHDWRLVGMILHDKPPFCEALDMAWILRRLDEWDLSIGLRPSSRSESPGAVPVNSIVVAVVDFDNRTGSELPRIGFLAHEILSRFLYNVPGIQLVTRDRLDRILREQGAPGVGRALVSPKGLSQIGLTLKADAIVTGAVIRYDIERRTFKGGVAFGNAHAAMDTHRMSVSLQVIDVSTGLVRFSRTYDTKRVDEYAQASSAPHRPVERANELLFDLIEQAGSDLRKALGEVAKGLSIAGQLVQVPVKTSPQGASVLVDGVFAGTTPLRLDLMMGIQDIRIEQAGYEPWHNRVRIEPGMRIDLALVPVAHGGGNGPQ
jgi:hypothetical protein